MALTREDLQAIREVVKEELEPVKTDVEVLKADVTELKTDVAELKTDVAELTTDVAGLKTAVEVLKTNVGGLETNVEGLRADVGGLKEDFNQMKSEMKQIRIEIEQLKLNYQNLAAQQDVFESLLAQMNRKIDDLDTRLRRVELTMENDLGRSIRLLAENHSDIVDKMNEAIRVQDKSNILEVQISGLRLKVDSFERELEEMKRQNEEKIA